jgi:hypothetical protein
MQEEDIDDRRFLAIVRDLASGEKPEMWRHKLDSLYPPPYWVMAWDVVHNLGDLDEAAVLAKAQSLIDRGLLYGCACGCRGDFELSTKGDAFLDAPSAPPSTDEGTNR